MNQRWFRSIVGTLILCFPFLSHSASLIYPIDQPYNSIRALGMGGAFAAVIDDYNTLLYNPAGLAFRKDGEINLFLRAGVAPKFLQLSGDVADAGEDTTKLNQAISNFYGENVYAQLSLGGFWVRPNWGMAFIPLDLDTNIGIHQQLGPALNMDTFVHSTMAMGFARQTEWLPGKFSVGFTGKLIARGAVQKAVAAVELAADPNVVSISDLGLGATIDFDVGSYWAPEFGRDSWFYYSQPSFAFVVRNILDLEFQNIGEEGLGTPPKLQRRFDLGSKWSLPKFSVFEPHMVFDIRDIGHSRWSFIKGTHFGAELLWKAFGWLKGAYRLGLNSGYWTAGISAHLVWFNLDIATWGEEIGIGDGKQESRRYMVQLNTNF